MLDGMELVTVLIAHSLVYWQTCGGAHRALTLDFSMYEEIC